MSDANPASCWRSATCRRTSAPVQALSDLSMKVHAGEVVALAGDNGAGKTTLIKAISGVYQPVGRGDPAARASRSPSPRPQEARDQGIETIYQDLALADNLSIGANIFLGREPMRKALRLPAGARPQEDGRGRARRRWRCSISTSAGWTRRCRNFSGGQRQAVAIGRAVYWNAQILIMDEPTAALGVPEQRKVIALIHQLKAQGRGVIFISHNLQDIFAVSDRIVVLRRGVHGGRAAHRRHHA